MHEKSDFILYSETLKNLGFNVAYLERFFNLYKFELPSFESVSRCRRLIQSEIPELSDTHISKYRKTVKEPEYREYSKTNVEK